MKKIAEERLWGWMVYGKKDGSLHTHREIFEYVMRNFIAKKRVKRLK